MQLRVYIAAPFTRKKEARAAKALLEKEGFIVTSRWIDLHGDVDKLDPSVQSYLEEQSLNDVEDVFDADVLVLLNIEKSEGKATECGLALAEGIPVILVGERTNIFHWLPVITKVYDLVEAVEKLRGFEKEIGELIASINPISTQILDGNILSPTQEA